MLYVATVEPLSIIETPDLLIEHVAEDRTIIKQWFSNREVRFVGAHTGCSCGFPSVKVDGDKPVEYYEGMPLDPDEADLRSVRALIQLLRDASVHHDVELYPVWDGEESEPPQGVIQWRLNELEPERFFFNKRFMHVVGATRNSG